jgi:hypothetical protein
MLLLLVCIALDAVTATTTLLYVYTEAVKNTVLRIRIRDPVPF